MNNKWKWIGLVSPSVTIVIALLAFFVNVSGFKERTHERLSQIDRRLDKLESTAISQRELDQRMDELRTRLGRIEGKIDSYGR